MTRAKHQYLRDAKRGRFFGSVKADAQARFWEKVDKAGAKQPHMETNCWVWTASVFDEDGYGKFWFEGKNRLAPRMAWLFETGKWPEDSALHRCDNPGCVRFEHLFDGDVGDNNRDCASKGRNRDISGDNNPMRTHPEKVRRGETHQTAKYSDAFVAELRNRYAQGGTTQADLARKYGVSKSYLCYIIHNKYRKGPTK